MSTEENILSFNFLDIARFLYRHRKRLIIVSLAAGIVAGIISFIIPPKFEAEVIFYPTTVNSIGNAMFTDVNKREADILSFGEEEEAEHALQVLKSEKCYSRIIRNFNLMKNYKIDPNGAYPQTKLSKMMENNISFSRTRYLSISIKVLDEDPVMAAKIANGIAAIYDSVKTEIQKEVANEAFLIIEEEFKNKEAEVWELKKGLNVLGKKGVLDIQKQTESITQSLYSLKATGGSAARIQQLQSEKDTLAKYGSEYTYLFETLLLELEEYSLLRKRYKKAKVDIEKTIPQKFLISSASVPEKKTKPVRKLLVLFGLVAGFIMAAVTLAFLEQKNKIIVSE
ncbi:MAG: tyrosine-protein kinase Etk/Wzc [Bacteroidia bacterium]|jgi:tyrosine-protein kinase Etk/Wzc